MARDAAIPVDVRRFLLGAIVSVPHLEALLLLHGEPGTAWTPAHVAQRLYVTADIARNLLQDLLDRGLVATSPAGEFAFAPYDPQLKPVIDRLAAIYSRNVVEIAKIVHAKSDLPAQLFADAFRLRKDT